MAAIKKASSAKKNAVKKNTVKKEAAKKTTAKTVSKRAVVKKNIAAKKGTVKKIVSSKLVIKIPQGGQVIRTFNLTPALPLDGKAANWLLVDPEKPTKDIDSMRFSFSPKSSDLEQQFERAIIQINIKQNENENGTWRFASDGVAVNPIFNDASHDVTVEITNAGYTLFAQVQLIDQTTADEINFGYIASFTDAISGLVTVYESEDPNIKMGRP